MKKMLTRGGTKYQTRNMNAREQKTTPHGAFYASSWGGHRRDKRKHANVSDSRSYSRHSSKRMRDVCGDVSKPRDSGLHLLHLEKPNNVGHSVENMKREKCESRRITGEKPLAPRCSVASRRVPGGSRSGGVHCAPVRTGGPLPSGEKKTASVHSQTSDITIKSHEPDTSESSHTPSTPSLRHEVLSRSVEPRAS